MDSPLIRAVGVSKRFRRGDHFDSLRDLLAARLLRRRIQRPAAQADFWALHDISFDVRPGEALGIIGPNGAGKSTMLKLLAGIMRPTEGTIDVCGRISALIELGAGFHNDLTGRENIHLNATILGMSREEIRRKFDAIADFAGIGEFLDTPVKRYSSGMHARLGFAIAAHVEPRVLLVDEVLSVGDRVFRAKCMDRMNRFLQDGVAVIFVSHDLGAVGRFCQRVLVLSGGRELFCGPAHEAICRYYDACREPVLDKQLAGQPIVSIKEVRVESPPGRPAVTLVPGAPVRVGMDLEFHGTMERPSFGLSIIRLEDHLTVFETSSTRLSVIAPPAKSGDRRQVRYDFRMNLLPGEYAIGLHVRERDALTYAIDQPRAARVMVVGERTIGGVAHIDPHVVVEALEDIDDFESERPTRVDEATASLLRDRATLPGAFAT
ncbi:MAG TPA: ABC transporter ATP-binding protein [Phycisphaerae bacterium]|nr:ABC transporter ATP-binding protein [Phycisphaerae bacterium]